MTATGDWAASHFLGIEAKSGKIEAKIIDFSDLASRAGSSLRRVQSKGRGISVTSPENSHYRRGTGRAKYFAGRGPDHHSSAVLNFDNSPISIQPLHHICLVLNKLELLNFCANVAYSRRKPRRAERRLYLLFWPHCNAPPTSGHHPMTNGRLLNRWMARSSIDSAVIASAKCRQQIK
eukprot:scaffold33193_cov70-Cyclotella_meneghiniana.AAC.10